MDAVTRHRIFSWTLMIALAMGWLAGGARHLAFALETTWGDLTGDLLVLGLALCFGAGVATRVVRPDRTQRWGIYGGLLMALAILAGTIAIDAVYVLPYHAGESGETWFSLWSSCRSGLACRWPSRRSWGGRGGTWRRSPWTAGGWLRTEAPSRGASGASSGACRARDIVGRAPRPASLPCR